MSNLFEKAFGKVTRTVETMTYRDQSMSRVALKRIYATAVEDLWEAVTNPERLARWFLPVEGELKPGGRYQLKGNAGGEILKCDPPHQLHLSWEFGESISWVEATITAESDAGASLTLAHFFIPDAHWDQYGPGATGVGWDLSILALGTHLGLDADRFATPEWTSTDEGKDFVRASSQAWGEAHIASGADEAKARAQATETSNAYTGEAEA